MGSCIGSVWKLHAPSDGLVGQLALRGNGPGNGPLARSGHMVQNHTSWDASWTVGLPKQSNSYQSSLTYLSFGSATVQLVSQHV